MGSSDQGTYEEKKQTMSIMADNRKIVSALATVSVVALELLEEKDDELEVDTFSELVFIPLIIKDRRKAVRVQGYAEDVVPSYTISDFRSHFRLSTGTFEALALELGNYPEIPTGPPHGGRLPISVSKHLLITLWFLGNQESIRSIADRFNVTKSSVFLCCKRVCDAIKNNVASRVIMWPTQDRVKVIMEGFRQHKSMPGVIGAIDGSHIAIKAPQECPENYVNRKGFYSVVLQGISDHEMRFIDCYTGWPGSVHDARVLKNSDFFAGVKNGIKFTNNNGYILGDCAYPLETWLMTPFKDNGHLTNQQKRYNFIHSSTRMVIERAFSLLKGRFRRLKYLDMIKIDEIPTIIIVACVLHNICLDKEDQYQDFIEDLEVEVNGFQNILNPDSQAFERRREIMAMIAP